MTQIIGYARVSTPDQDLEIQRRRLEQAGAVRVYVDTISGKSLKRPGWADLLNYARAGDTIAVVRLDRLARSLHSLLGLVDELRALDIGLMSLEERVDTTTPSGKCMMQMIGVLAEFERELIISRTRDALDIARARGKHIGRRPLPKEKIEAAIALVETGEMSPDDVAATLGIGRTAVYEALRARREARTTVEAPPIKRPYRRRARSSAQTAGS